MSISLLFIIMLMPFIISVAAVEVNKNHLISVLENALLLPHPTNLPSTRQHRASSSSSENTCEIAQFPGRKFRRSLTLGVSPQAISKLCHRIHSYLPPFVIWRYQPYPFPKPQVLGGDVLLIMNDEAELAQHQNDWIESHQRLNLSVGLFLLSSSSSLVTPKTSLFDYVLVSSPNILVLKQPTNDKNNNMTTFIGRCCADKTKSNLYKVLPHGPLMGTSDSGHLPDSFWPSSLRRNKCFAGHTKHKEDKEDDEFCFTGIPLPLAPFKSGHVRLGHTVFALFHNQHQDCFQGNSILEMLSHGTIPVQVGCFEDNQGVPWVVTTNWKQALEEMKRLISRPGELDLMQDKCTAWYFEHQKCISWDLEQVLGLAMEEKYI